MTVGISDQYHRRELILNSGAFRALRWSTIMCLGLCYSKYM